MTCGRGPDYFWRGRSTLVHHAGALSFVGVELGRESFARSRAARRPLILSTWIRKMIGTP